MEGDLIFLDSKKIIVFNLLTRETCYNFISSDIFIIQNVRRQINWKFKSAGLDLFSEGVFQLQTNQHNTLLRK